MQVFHFCFAFNFDCCDFYSEIVVTQIELLATRFLFFFAASLRHSPFFVIHNKIPEGFSWLIYHCRKWLTNKTNVIYQCKQSVGCSVFRQLSMLKLFAIISGDIIICCLFVLKVIFMITNSIAEAFISYHT